MRWAASALAVLGLLTSALLLPSCGGEEQGSSASTVTGPATDVPVPVGGARGSGDSGGGVEQFEREKADRSIQKFGREGDAVEFAQAAAAVHGYLDARAAGAWEIACTYLVGDAAASLSKVAQREKGDCPEVLAALSAPIPAASRREAAVADVGALRVEGRRAFALFHGARNRDFFMPMALDPDGKWKVAALAPSPLD